jgi:hypothetical protein
MTLHPGGPTMIPDTLVSRERIHHFKELFANTVN